MTSGLLGNQIFLRSSHPPAPDSASGNPRVRSPPKPPGSTPKRLLEPANPQLFAFYTSRRASARDPPLGAAELTNERALSPRRLRIGRLAPASLLCSGRGAPRSDWDRRARYAGSGGACAVSRRPRGPVSRGLEAESLAAETAAAGGGGGGD